MTDKKHSYKNPTGLKTFYYGAPYYPEHWEADVRATDDERMAAAGFNAVRMAEFAWDLMEPEEGIYDFALFDDVITTLGEHGISTILCTPTATPPRWLTKNSPDTLRVTADNVPLQHGSRQQCCHASSRFRQYSRAITQAMADHFAQNPFVVGWQTDNEFHCHFSECHCQACQQAFREFLQNQLAWKIKRYFRQPDEWVSHLIRAGLSWGEYQAIRNQGRANP